MDSLSTFATPNRPATLCCATSQHPTSQTRSVDQDNCKMKTPPFGTFEIEVPSENVQDELAFKHLSRDSAKKSQNDDSISSELSIDLLSKDRTEENDDSKLQSLESSSGSCRWNPDDSDYSLNVLLAPLRNSEDEDDDDDGKYETATTTTATTSTSSSTWFTPSEAAYAEASDSLSTSSNHSLFGSDYSLNQARLRVRPNKSRSSNHGNAKNRALLDTSSHHSTNSIDSIDTAFSFRNNINTSLPENIEVTQDSQQQQQPAQLFKPKATRNASVSFYPRVRIQRVPPRKMIPPEQMEAVWYSRDEFHVIRKECFNTIRLMKDDEDATDEDSPLFDENGGELCRRGLEYKTPKAYKRRQKQKKDVRMVVFDELDFQEEQGMDDPLWLAKLSRDQSRACVEAAIETARVDERQAKQYLGC